MTTNFEQRKVNSVAAERGESLRPSEYRKGVPLRGDVEYWKVVSKTTGARYLFPSQESAERFVNGLIGGGYVETD